MIRIPERWSARWFSGVYRLLTEKQPLRGAGDPDGVVVAPVGTLYTRTDGGAGTTLYVKESGTDENGWVAK